MANDDVLPEWDHDGDDEAGRCALCGEGFRPNDELGEMNGKARPMYGVDSNVTITGGLVHAQCGLDAGWDVS